MKEKFLRFDIAQVEKTGEENGFLRAKVTLAKAGVFPYMYPDGKLRFEAKLPEELFSTETINSAKNAPITEDHPPVSDSDGLVTPNNYSKYVKGALGDSIEFDGGYLVGHEMIYDSALREKVKSGEKVEVSIGFETDVDFTPGEYEGRRYDAVQRNIRINHIAHVSEGRAGSDVKAHLDSYSSKLAIMQKEITMPQTATVKNDRKDILSPLKDFFKALFRADSEDQLVEAINGIGTATQAVQNMEPSANPGESKVMSEEVAKLKAEIDLLSKLVEEKTKLLNEATSQATLDAKVQERISLITAAKSVNPDLKADGLSDAEIKYKVIESVFPGKFKQDSLSPVAINAHYEAALELAREKASLRQDSNSPETRLDEKAIEAKKEARLNIKKD